MLNAKNLENQNIYVSDAQDQKTYAQFPLSSAQNRMFILNQLDRGSTAYNMSIVEHLGKIFAWDKFEQAFHQLIQRHESLRTSFHLTPEGPVQRVHTQVDFQFEHLEAEGNKLEELKQAFIRPFDLEKAPLVRVAMTQLENGEHIMLLDMHHIVSDGISMGIIQQDFIQILSGNYLAPLSYQYKDFALLQQEGKNSSLYSSWGKYWLSKFQGELPSLNLPTDHAIQGIQDYQGQILELSISAKLTAKIRGILKEKQCTSYAFFLAAYNVLLQKYTGDEDIIIGCSASGRVNSDWGRVVGMFVNTLATRNYPSSSKNFDQFLQEVAFNSLEEIQYQGYQFDDLVENLGLARKAKRNPLFDTLFNYLNFKESRGIPENNKGHRKNEAKFDLSLTVKEFRNTFSFEIEYASALFESESIDRLAQHFLILLEQLGENAQSKIRDIEILSLDEKRQLLIEFNDTADSNLANLNLVDLFEEQVRKTPDKIAIVDKNQSISFKELDTKSSQLAAYLLSQGLDSEDIVGIMLSRRYEMFLSILAVLKAGCAYLPLDPKFPIDRLNYMVEHSNLQLLLSEKSLSIRHEKFEKELKIIDVLSEKYYVKTSEHGKVSLSPNNLAYLIYTSGSTGQPKGIAIEHRSVVNLVEAVANRIDAKGSHSILCLTTMSFDIFVTESFLPLLKGMKIVLADSNDQVDSSALSKLIQTHEVDLMQITPAHLSSLIFGGNIEFLHSLKIIISGGEPFPMRLLDELRKNYRGKIYNMYGPTETTVYSTMQDLSDKSVIDIGKPTRNTQAYVLSKNNQLQPIGVVGELCIGGKGLARAYWNREDLTAEKFIENPFVEGERIYKTGDLASWKKSGELHLLGRIDHQVKIRGFRIELGEIEQNLLKKPAIQEVTVVAKGEEEKYLLAYYVSDEKLESSDLRKHLGSLVPDYMIPAYFQQLDQLPLTPNGKVNRKALPQIEISTSESHQAAKSDTEKALLAIWAKVLKLNPDQISANRSFFELGGHSLRATMMANQVSSQLEINLPLREVFTRQSIAELAKFIDNTETQTSHSIPKAEQQAYYPLSSAQKRMYFLYEYDKESLVYNMPEFIHMGGNLDAEKLTQVLNQLIERHASLRTSFELIGEEVLQKVADKVDFQLERYTATESELSDVLSGFIRPFDLGKAPLFRAALLARPSDHPEQDFLLLIDMHHVISDGVSLQVLTEEFTALYNGKNLPLPELQYTDYASWQQSESQQAKILAQQEYWLSQFEETAPVLELPMDFPRSLEQSFEGRIYHFEIGKEETEGLRKIAQESGSTLFMVLLSVFNILLAKLSNEDDIVVGTVVAGREHVQLQQMIGMFVRTLALRNYPQADLSFLEFLEQVKQSSLAAFENQAFPYEELVDLLQIPRNTGRNPLFDVFFTYESIEHTAEEMAQIDTQYVDNKHIVAKFDVSLTAVEAQENLFLNFEYAIELYKRETIERFAQYFKQIISSVFASPKTLLKEIDIVSEQEKEKLLFEFNRAAEENPRDATVIKLFEERARLNPADLAITCQGQSMSYTELNVRVNQLAHYLLSVEKIGKNEVIALYLKRSPAMIIAALATLKVGASYIPLDPKLPYDRISSILEEADTKCLISDLEASSIFSTAVSVINLETEKEKLECLGTENIELAIEPSQLAYIIYTSGSTGKPKGIQIEHHSLLDYALTFKEHFFLNSEDKVVQQASFSFDIAVEEIFPALISGASILILPEGGLNIPDMLTRIKEEKASILSTTPLVLNELNQHRENLESLRVIISGGDLLLPSYVDNLLPTHNIYNTYGPTEATVCISYHKIRTQADVQLIGKPIRNRSVYILNKQDQLCPISVPGEICVSGPGLARAYVNNEKLSREKFVANPFEAGTRMYRTGDLGRWLANGDLEFLGRIDHQVKIRGFRIELGEIEQCLLEYKAIEEAVVLVFGEEDKYLVAYYVSDQSLPPSDLRSYLGQNMPDYMIPAYFQHLDQLPVNTNGKVNRKALPKVEIGAGENYQKAESNTEKALLKIWVKVLKLNPDQISVNQSFFELGGHSLRATVMVNQVANRLGVNLPLKEVFARQSIAELALFIDQAEAQDIVSIPKVEKRPHYPLSSAQKRMYFLYEFDKESLVYNMPEFIHLGGNLDFEKLEQAFQLLIQRHGSLRTSFELIGDEVVQKVADKVDFKVERYTATESELDRLMHEFVRPFDLKQSPLIRVGLVARPEEAPKQDYLLLVDLHHIIGDGVSFQVLAEEFLALYKGIKLPFPKLSYLDYASWQQSESEESSLNNKKDYWLDVFTEPVPVLDLGADFRRPAVQSFEGAVYNFEIGELETEKLKEISKKTGSTLFMLLLALFNVLLSKLSKEEDITIGTVVAGRDHADLEKVIGMFVRTLALRNYPKSGLSFLQFLEQVKQRSLSGFEHQAFPYEELVDLLEIPRNTGRNPLFDVMFAFQNFEETNEKLEEVETRYVVAKHHISKFDLTLTAISSPRQMAFNFEYATSLFREETIERFAIYFKKIISSIVLNPSLLLADIDILSEQEKKQLLSGFTQNQRPYPFHKTVVQLFEEQQHKTPENCALSFEGKSMSYAELAEASSRLQSTLLQNGIERGDIVAVIAEPSIEMIIALWGILKAGASFLPIASDNPVERIAYILEDSQCKALLTSQEITQSIGFEGNFIDLFAPSTYLQTSPIKPVIQGLPEDLAYVIYTSGSTGKPKGVMISHESLCNLCFWHNEHFEVKEQDRASKFAGFGFDASVWEIFPYLIVGASIHIVPQEIRYEVVKLNDYFERQNISISFLPTQIAEQFMQLENASLRILLTGGDKLHTRRSQSYRVFNNYGPTENTVVSSCFEIKKNYHNIPIGKAIANTEILILDDHQKLSPRGVVGELCISGVGLAKGYLHKPVLSKEKFIDHPYRENTSLYKTGDKARYLTDGNIEFLGRIDHQVKIRGFRIELGEVEKQLLDHTAIKEALVIVKGEQEKYLQAFFVSNTDLSRSELKNHLSQSLPAYMLPEQYQRLDRFPISSNGKIDRKALEKMELIRERNFLAPRTETEKKLVEVWAQVLNLKYSEISIDQSFFELGGHSLRAAVMANKMAKLSDVSLPLKEVFARQNISSIAEYIDQAEKTPFKAISKAPRQAFYPLSFAQKRMYFLYQFDKNSRVYNMPEFVQLEGAVDEGKILYAFQKLIERHESLRTSFEVIGHDFVQKVEGNIEFELEKYYADEREFDLVISSFIRPFDLSQAGQIRAGLIHPKSKDLSGAVLMIDMHHIISDGVSFEILTKEFTALYNGESLPPVALQYVDFVAWQNSDEIQDKLQEHKAYWLKEYENPVSILELPYDYPRPTVQSFEGEIVYFGIGEEESKRLRQIAEQGGATLFMVLLSIFNILLSKLSNEKDIVVATVLAGRDHADVEEMIGMFVRTLALRNYPIPELSYENFLESVRKKTLNGFENQNYPFENLVDELNLSRDAGRNPLFDVMFAFQDQGEEQEDLVEVQSSQIQAGHSVAKFDLSLTGLASGNEIFLNFEYATALFNKESIQKFVDYFTKIVSTIVADPSIKLKDIDILSKTERERILIEFNQSKEELSIEEHLIERFEKQVRTHPHKIALVFEDENMTYEELNNRVNQLSYTLMQEGLGSGSVIGLLLDRSMEMIVAMLASLKVGATYLPIDTEQPKKRIQTLLADSQSEYLLSEKKFAHVFPKKLPVLDLYAEDSYSSKSVNPATTFVPEQRAYIIYTSGSTGKPKGVEICQHAVLNLIDSQIINYEIDNDERIFQFSNISFDASVEQIYLALLSGNSLVLSSKNTLLDPQKFHAYIRDQKITHLDLTPSYLESIKADFNPELKRIIVGGEACNPQTLQELAQSYQVHNVYGPTEATVSAIQYKVPSYENFRSIPLGKPLHNMEAYILDENLEPLAIGVKGKLYLGGAGLAKSYLNDPGLTKKKFIENPFKPDTHLYDTGDLAHWLSSGNIVFRGRSDSQIKIRGFRVEMGEIEHLLMSHEDIDEAVVIAEQKEEVRLYAYYSSPTEIAQTSLVDFLSKKLPTYMIPAHFIYVEIFSLTQSGKIDRKALPKIQMDWTANYQAPESETEEKLVKIWMEVLNLEYKQISRDKNFFDLGGHSLKVALLINLIREQLKLEVSIQEVFEKPSIAGISALIEKKKYKSSTQQGDEVLSLLRGEENADQHVFFIHDGGGDIHAYQALTAQLPKSNYWGLRANGADVYGPQEQSISGLATRYLKSIKRIQPTGPYKILGWSLGGLIAFEMAKQLENQGDKLQLLAMIDTVLPDQDTPQFVPEFSFEVEKELILRNLNLDFETPPSPVSVEELWRKSIQRLIETKPEQNSLQALIPESMIPLIPQPDQLDTQNLIKQFNLIRSLEFAINTYRISGSLNSSLLYVKASETDWSYLHFQKYLKNEIILEEIEATHFSIMQDQALLKLAQIISSRIKN